MDPMASPSGIGRQLTGRDAPNRRTDLTWSAGVMLLTNVVPSSGSGHLDGEQGAGVLREVEIGAGVGQRALCPW